MRRLDLAGLRQLEAERGEKFRERGELLLRGLIMHAIDQGRALGFKFFGRGDVGRDHELLDQPMRVEAERGSDAAHAPGFVELDLALGQIEVEGSALGAGARKAAIGAP